FSTNLSSTSCFRFLSCITYFSLLYRVGISLVNLLSHLTLFLSPTTLQYSDNISDFTAICSGQYGYSLCRSCNSFGYSKSTSNICPFFELLLTFSSLKSSVSIHLNLPNVILCTIAQPYKLFASK